MQGEQVYYSKTEFEASPLNRPTKTLAPGNSWAGSNIGVEMQYRINDANDAVRIWNITNTTLSYDATSKNVPYNRNREEQNEAIQFLQDPHLMQHTNECIAKSGVIGEEHNRLLMYLIFTSRKREHPLHVISMGSSGTCKSHLQEKVGELIPQEDKIEITTLSENAFYYFGQTELHHRIN